MIFIGKQTRRESCVDRQSGAVLIPFNSVDLSAVGWALRSDSSRRDFRTMPGSKVYQLGKTCVSKAPVYVVWYFWARGLAFFGSFQATCEQGRRAVRSLLDTNRWYRTVFNEHAGGDKQHCVDGHTKLDSPIRCYRRVAHRSDIFTRDRQRLYTAVIITVVHEAKHGGSRHCCMAASITARQQLRCWWRRYGTRPLVVPTTVLLY